MNLSFLSSICNFLSANGLTVSLLALTILLVVAWTFADCYEDPIRQEIERSPHGA